MTEVYGYTTCIYSKGQYHCRLWGWEGRICIVSCHRTSHTHTHVCAQIQNRSDLFGESLIAVEIQLDVTGRWQVTVRWWSGWSTIGLLWIQPVVILPHSPLPPSRLGPYLNARYVREPRRENVDTQTHPPWEYGYHCSTLIKRWETLWCDVTVVSEKMDGGKLSPAGCVCERCGGMVESRRDGIVKWGQLQYMDDKQTADLGAFLTMLSVYRVVLRFVCVCV